MAAKRASVPDPLLLDEGMWTLDNLPTKKLKKHYGFVPDENWVAEAQRAAVRFNDGGSGSFVSSKGLVLTNHHVAMGQLQKLSSAENNYVRDGFFAKTTKQEAKCPDLELNQLVGMTNVSKRVHKALATAKTPKQQHEIVRATIADIEKEAHERSGLRANVVELYQGGEYWLYEYKKYTDIRLVMAPESGVAFFGGDPDNFSYPRFNLDFAFFRVYEKNKPIASKHFFPFFEGGCNEGDLTFVLGHPGSTQRLLTTEQLRYQRDIATPKRLTMLQERLDVLRQFSSKGEEQARQARDAIFGLENAFKIISGEYERLCEDAVFQRKVYEQKSLVVGAASKPGLAKPTKQALATIAKLQKKVEDKNEVLTFRRLNAYRLVGMAELIVRAVVELEKPNAKRYEEFRDSNLASLYHRLYSPAPVYLGLEQVMLELSLDESYERLGHADPFVRAAMGDKTAAQAAKAALSRTTLGDPAVRKALIEGGIKAVNASKDPLIDLARRVDVYTREGRDWFERDIDGPLRAAGEAVAKARFALYGKSVYPDATFTLRLAYGQPKGYAFNKTLVPFKTTFFGLFDRSASFDNKPPYDLPAGILKAQKKIALDTPINFVSTHDIIGGNSGSPVIDTKRRVVGLIFDGNAQSFACNYLYERETGRAVSVDVRGIIEALRSVYGMKSLLAELKPLKK